MVEKKNVVKIEIDSCHLCPNASLKFHKEIMRGGMFCQSDRSCIYLREGWGNCSIPVWCPRLKQNQPKVMRGLRAKIPGIIDEAIGV